jgi:hypothetical protein
MILKRTAITLMVTVSTFGLMGLMLANLSSNASPSALLLTPTATLCPLATSEPFLVEPVTSSTRLFSQDVHITLGNCEAVTVTSESGTFASDGPCYWPPAQVEIKLRPSTVHHLQVSGKVRRIEHNGCVYGGYTLSTRRDRFGAPLVITQVFTVAAQSYFPRIWREKP